MKKMFLLFSHNLTPSQEFDVQKSLNVNEFVFLPNELQVLWSNIPCDLELLKDYLIPFKKFLFENSNFEDVVLVQGDFGAVYHMVNFAKDLGLKTVYATTKRVVEEIVIDGKTVKKSIFEHERFREYE